MSGKQPARPPTALKGEKRGSHIIPAQVGKFFSEIRHYNTFESYKNNIINKNLEDFKKIVNSSNLLEELTRKYYNDKDFLKFIEKYQNYDITMETLLKNNVQKIIIRNNSKYAYYLYNVFNLNDLYVNALRYRNSGLVNYLAKNNYTIDCFNKDFLINYKDCNRQEGCIQKLIDIHFDENLKQAYNGRPNNECIDLLLRVGITNPNKRVEYSRGMKLAPLGVAILRKNADLVKSLLLSKVRIDEIFNEGSPDKYLDKIVYVDGGDLETLKVFVDFKLPINAVSKDWKKLLDYTKNNKAFNELLLKLPR